MIRRVCCLLLGALMYMPVWGQEPQNTVAEEIRNERDRQWQEISRQLKHNEQELQFLKDKLAGIDERRTQEKIETMQHLQIALDHRLQIIEEAPKSRISLNGQLAFTELLSIQRDVQPAGLFLSARQFFDDLGAIGQLQRYETYVQWKSQFDLWYKQSGQQDQVANLVNQSLKLLTSPAKTIPVYGSIAQGASTGITQLMGGIGKRHQQLRQKTPEMLRLFQVLSQFEHQKSVIDHEWALVTRELDQLKEENIRMVQEQLQYYQLSKFDYEQQYVEETLDIRRDVYKQQCRKQIARIHEDMARDESRKNQWMGQVESFMLQVQSLRLRFGQLTLRMVSNMQEYEQLIQAYSDPEKFPPAFTQEVSKLGLSLQTVKSKLDATFNPARYIEDSAIMYIERNLP